MASFLRELTIVLSLTLLGCGYSLFSGLAPLPWAAVELQAGEIRLEDAEALEAIWVDAREHGDFLENAIAGAIWYDLSDEGNALLALAEAWMEEPRPIIVYCADEACGTSKEVAERVRGVLGDAEIYSLKGGWPQ